MYINYLTNRKLLGYKGFINTQYDNRLVLITNFRVIFIKNVTLSGKHKVFMIIGVMIIIFSNVKSVDAIGTSLLP